MLVNLMLIVACFATVTILFMVIRLRDTKSRYLPLFVCVAVVAFLLISYLAYGVVSIATEAQRSLEQAQAQAKLDAILRDQSWKD